MSSSFVWLAFELDGEIEEIQVQVTATTTVAELRHRVFTQSLFPLPAGVGERDLALAREEASSVGSSVRLRALKLTDVVCDVAAPPKHALTVSLMRGSYVVSSRGSFIRSESTRSVNASADCAVTTANTAVTDEWTETERSLRRARPALRWQYDVIADKWQQTASLITIADDGSAWRDLSLPTTAFGVRSSDVSEAVALGEARARAIAVHWATLMTVALAGDASLVPRVRSLDAWQTPTDGLWYLVEAAPVHDDSGGSKTSAATAASAAAALAHFVFEQTRGRAVVLLEACDASGVFGDAVVHTNFVDDINARDAGDAGLKEFAGKHACTELCKRLALRSFDAIAAEVAASPKSALSASISGFGSDGGAGGAGGTGGGSSLGASASQSVAKLMLLTSSKSLNARQPLTPRTTARRSQYVAKAKEARLASKEDAGKTYTLDAASPRGDIGVLFTLAEHKTCVNALLWHGEHLLSASSDKTVRVWSLASFECVQTLSGHTQEVTALWRSDSNVFSASQDGTVRAWSLTVPLEPRATLRADDDVWGVCTAAGRVFAAAAKNIVWWTQTSDTAFERSRKQLEGHKKTIKALTATGDYLFSGSNDKSIRVWDARSLECKYTMNDHDGWITSLFIHDKLLYSCSVDSLIKVWDLTTLSCVRTLKNTQRLECGTVWQDHVFAGTEDARIWAYPLGGTESVATLKEHKLAVLALAASPDLIFSGSYDGTIKVWGSMNAE
jgi:hypothetical protein